jgi:putative endonuclease
MAFFVYILASRRNGTLYVGMTDDLTRRVWQHRNDLIPGFTKRYGVKTLVWYEPHESRQSAFMREHRLKKWNRAWKLALIEKDNPGWQDLWQRSRRSNDRKKDWVPRIGVRSTPSFGRLCAGMSGVS